MYEDQKKRIADLNQSMQKAKETAETSKAEHEERMKHIEDLDTQHKVREGVTKNSTGVWFLTLRAKYFVSQVT